MVLRRRRLALGAGPAAKRLASSPWRASKAPSTLRLRTARQQVMNTSIGARPVSRHQPREMSLLAGSFMVEYVRSAAVRRA
jgi:hypothetical protein